MHEKTLPAEIGDWLRVVRSRFVELVPELLPLFETYAAEAVFGRRYLDSELTRLPLGARVLEIGAGSMLLSCQLVREGFMVTALEPTGGGFSHFSRMRQIVQEVACSAGCCPRILDVSGECMSEQSVFDFAFSINVMEHVNNVSLVLERVGASLAGGATYRFTCPNYHFPYEPHFNIPTLFSKSLTERLLGRKIFASQAMADPAGTWNSLNWISVSRVRKSVARLPDLRVDFNRELLVSTLERMVSDHDFASRRSPLLRKLLAVLVGSRAHRLCRFIPATIQPIMDCSVVKVGSGGST